MSQDSGSSSAGDLARKRSRTIIGLVSGTSADGVSSVVTKISRYWTQIDVKLIRFRTYPYPRNLRREVFNLFNPETASVNDVCHLNFVLGHFFADCALKIANDADMQIGEVDLVGSHGQTVCHRPSLRRGSGYSTRSTFQIGEASVIAERTGVATVGDFRKRDVAAGGQGAPLTPYMDYVLHRSRKLNRVLQNVGGIANFTFIPANGSVEEIIALDTGPGNMVIDALVRHYTRGRQTYDEDGKIAERGNVSRELLGELLRHPYFKRLPPKTTGREIFGEQYAAKIIEKARRKDLRTEDVVATATALTAETIMKAYERFITKRYEIDEAYVSGGGTRNPAIMRRLREGLAPVKVLEYDGLGVPSEAKEAVLFAILANEHVMGVPCNIPVATGASRRVVLGALTPS